MSRIFTIGFLFVVCISACKRATQEARQNELLEGESVNYLFDPVSETCAVVKNPGYNNAYAWPVPCAKVKDKLDPSVRAQVEAMLKKLLPESPH